MIHSKQILVSSIPSDDSSADSSASTIEKAKAAFCRILCGPPEESKKAVLRRSWIKSLAKCLVHIPSAFAMAAVIYFNLVGLFIGIDLSGSSTARAQSFDRLALQVTAKLLELFAVASLGAILMDAVRHKLVFGADGIPLGLLLSKAQFTDISFLLSKDFRAGSLLTDFKVGKRTYLNRVVFVVLIITCSTLALFVGPASAILLIPTYFDAWPAGGAHFWLNGDLSPAALDIDLVRDANCALQGNISALPNSTNWQYASCPWAGYTGLSQYWTQERAGVSPDVTYSVGTFTQDIRLTWTPEAQAITLSRSGKRPNFRFAVRSAAVGTNIAMASFARQIAGIDWCSAINFPLGWKRRYQYRQLNSTVASIEGQLPVVRTQCDMWGGGGALFPNNTYPPGNAPSPGEQYVRFPLMLDYGPSDRWRDLFYYIPVPILNDSRPQTKWVDIPSGPSGVYEDLGGDVIKNGETDQYPTALLLIRGPVLDWELSGDIACSVQADWLEGYHQTSDICWTEEPTQQGVLSSADQQTLQDWIDAVPFNSRAHFGHLEPNYRTWPGWQQINMTTNWLDLLTPQLPVAGPGYTTLACVLDQVLTHQVREYFSDYALYNQATNAAALVTAIVSSFVADGASRLGWDQNHAYNLSEQTVSHTSDQSNYTHPSWSYGAKTWLQSWRQLLFGTAELMPNARYKSENGKLYRLDVTIAGFGLKASGLTDWLALTILFVQLALIVIHLVYIMSTRNDSSSWSSLTDMFVLAQTSSPPRRLLDNTCVGVESHKTLQVRVKVRERLNHGGLGREMLHLEVDGDEGSIVTADRKYGVC